ncbi:MAG TPA: hypothetical protein VKU00_09115 [Chthonomonadaceae bacterium]|nr:hypothetical protein [Chthonomonadaceae bacterium]
MSPYGSSYPPPEYRMAPKVRFEAIGEAWQLFSQQMGTWILALLIFLAIYFAIYIGIYVVLMVGIFGTLMATGGSASGQHGGDPSAMLGVLFLGYSILALVILALVSYFTAGMLRMAIRQVRGEPIGIGDLFSGGDAFLPVLGATLLVGLATGIGGMLLVIPGFIVAGLFFLTIPLIVDRKMGVIEAMTASWNALKSDWLMATLFAFVLPLIAGLGALACGFGMLFTMPLLYLGMAVVYRDFFMPGLPQNNPNALYPPPVGAAYPPPQYPYPPTTGYSAPTEPVYPPPMETVTTAMDISYDTPVETPPPPPDTSYPTSMDTNPAPPTDTGNFTPTEMPYSPPPDTSASTPVDTTPAPPTDTNPPSQP